MSNQPIKDPYIEGWKAFEKGKKRRTNKYDCHEKSEEFRLWDDGWLASRTTLVKLGHLLLTH